MTRRLVLFVTPIGIGLGLVAAVMFARPDVARPLDPPEVPASAPPPQPPVLVPLPPVAKKVPHREARHDEAVFDDYAWLEDRDDPGVRAYLDAENAYAEAMRKPRAGLERRLEQEMLARLPERDETPPYRFGDFLYYTRWEREQEHQIVRRRRPEPGAPEEVVLDVNDLARQVGHLEYRWHVVRRDGTRLACLADPTGAEQSTLFVRDLATGLWTDRIEGVDWSCAWSQRTNALYYTVRRNGEGLICRRMPGRTEDAVLLSTKGPVDVYVRENFVIASLNESGNHRILQTEDQDTGPWEWTEADPVVALGHRRASDPVSPMARFGGYAGSWESREAQTRLRITNEKTGAWHWVTFSEPVYSLGPGEGFQYGGVCRFLYESPTTPPSHFEYDPDRRDRKLLKVDEVPGHDPARYRTERLWAVSADRTYVPISLVCRKGVPDTGPRPLVLDVYGAFGISADTGFSRERLSLLDRGVIYAWAHVRGGSEMGPSWHDAGRGRHKPRSIDDLVAVAELLVSRGLTSPDRLALTGDSAGGLVVAAAAQRRPDLFRAAVTCVPLLDATRNRHPEEFGDADDPFERREIRSWSPYQTLAAGPGPALLVRSAMNDARVPYWQPAKYVAKLRALRTGDRPILLQVDPVGGHFLASGRRAGIRETARQYAFLLTQLHVGE